MLKLNFQKSNLFAVLIFLLFFIFPLKAEAAVLFFKVSEEKYYWKDIFTVEIRLNTEGETVNATKVKLNFPQDKLKIVDVTKKDSILSLWPEGPTYSNERGELSFIGGVPGGFKGEENLLSIIFEVNKPPELEEEVKLKFSDTSLVLLNDGLGTRAHLRMREALFTILPQERETYLNEWQKQLREDITPPEPFEIILIRDPLIFDGKYFIIFHTSDRETGIDYYEVKEGDREWKKADMPYLLEDQSLQSIIRVRAVDKAGNERISIRVPLPKPFYKKKGFTIGVILIIIILTILVLSYLFRRFFKKIRTTSLKLKK